MAQLHFGACCGAQRSHGTTQCAARVLQRQPVRHTRAPAPQYMPEALTQAHWGCVGLGGGGHRLGTLLHMQFLYSLDSSQCHLLQGHSVCNASVGLQQILVSKLGPVSTQGLHFMAANLGGTTGIVVTWWCAARQHPPAGQGLPCRGELAVLGGQAHHGGLQGRQCALHAADS